MVLEVYLRLHLYLAQRAHGPRLVSRASHNPITSLSINCLKLIIDSTYLDIFYIETLIALDKDCLGVCSFCTIHCKVKYVSTYLLL